MENKIPNYQEYNYNFDEIDAKTDEEKYRMLYTYCLKASIGLGVTDSSWLKNNLFRPIRLEADSATVAAIQSIESFELGLGDTRYRVGTIGRFEVWRNLLADNNYVLITYNGKVARINVNGLATRL